MPPPSKTYSLLASGLAVAAVAVAVLLVVVLKQDPQSQAFDDGELGQVGTSLSTSDVNDVSANASEIATLQDQVRTLANATQALAAQMQSMAEQIQSLKDGAVADQSTATNTSSAPSTDTIVTESSEFADSGIKNRDLARIQSQFENDDIDADWQLAAQQDIGLFAQNERFTVHTVSCKAKICKAQIELPEGSTLENIVFKFGSYLPWAASIALSEPIDSQASTVEVFFQRKS